MLTQNDLRQIGELMDKKLKPVKKDIKEIRKSVNIIADYFDREALSLYSRVNRIERHLKLPPN